MARTVLLLQRTSQPVGDRPVKGPVITHLQTTIGTRLVNVPIGQPFEASETDARHLGELVLGPDLQWGTPVDPTSATATTDAPVPGAPPTFPNAGVDGATEGEATPVADSATAKGKSR